MRNLSFVKKMTALAMALMFLVVSNVTGIKSVVPNFTEPTMLKVPFPGMKSSAPNSHPMNDVCMACLRSIGELKTQPSKIEIAV